jgi:hypothetical protein
MTTNIFVKQLTAAAFKQQSKVIGTMDLIRNPKTGKVFFSYNTDDGQTVLRASSRFLEPEYLSRATTHGVMFGMTADGIWIGYAKGDSANVLLSGV